MEKLINLLNEYDKSENVNAYRWDLEGGDIIGYNRFRGGYETINVSESVIISKWYEFIKRLVENDKIKTPHELDELPQIYGVDYDSKESKSDRLIMLLSVSESPIDFLISILR